MDKNIIWIASYPKSGNTWIRSILSSLFYTEDGHFNFNILKKINTFDRPFYFNEVIKENKVSTYDLTTLAKFRVSAQKLFNKKNTLRYFKTHAANIKIDGFDYTNQDTTKCVIYIVRDPRDVVLSYSKFSGLNINDVVKIIKDEKFTVKNKESQYFTHWSRWDYHVSSWLIPDYPKIVIKYEDMIDKPMQTIMQLIMFLKNVGIESNFTDQKIVNAVESTNFTNLNKMETELGFEESIYGTKFFNIGKKNQWKKSLSVLHAQEIEKSFAQTMKKFDYL
tara:strand:+ start:1126 stop:1959 length:834 start_codon:yes stop_codon:yes gene_type:complete